MSAADQLASASFKAALLAQRWESTPDRLAALSRVVRPAVEAATEALDGLTDLSSRLVRRHLMEVCLCVMQAAEEGKDGGWLAGRAARNLDAAARVVRRSDDAAAPVGGDAA